MKKFAVFFLILTLALSIAACGEESQLDKEALKAVEAVLGSLNELPADAESAIEKLGSDARLEETQSGQDPAAQDYKKDVFAVGKDTVVYHSVRNDDIAVAGESRTYLVQTSTVYYGQLVDQKGAQATVKFVGAHVKMTVLQGDPAQAIEDYRAALQQTDFTKKQKDALISLISGETVFVDPASVSLWEILVDKDPEMLYVKNEKHNLFLLLRNEESGASLHYHTDYDSQDRPIRSVAFYFDDEGNLYIDSIGETAYLQEGNTIIHHTKDTQFGSMSEEIVSYLEMKFWFEDGSNMSTKFVTVREKNYYENGQLSLDRSLDENGNEVLVTYSESGVKETESYTDEEGYLVSIFYRENGNKRRLERRLDDISFDTTYFENGNKETETKSVDFRTLLYKEYWDNGNPKTEIEYFEESGRIFRDVIYNYDDGSIQTLLEYYDNEEHTMKTEIHMEGLKPSKYTYYENGQPETQIIYHDNGKTAEHYQYYETGKLAISIYYDEDGKEYYREERFENGAIKVEKGLQSWSGDTVDVIGNENFQIIRSHVWFASGDERIDEYWENGNLKYHYFKFAAGWGYEEFYDKNGNQTGGNNF